MEAANQITENWTITKIVNKYPKTVNVLLKYNIYFKDCAGKNCTTIADRATASNIDISVLLRDLNQIADSIESTL